MSGPIFYELWAEAVKRLAKSRQEADHWREVAEVMLKEIAALRAENKELQSRRDTPPTLGTKVRVSPGTNPRDPLR